MELINIEQMNRFENGNFQSPRIGNTARDRTQDNEVSSFCPVYL